MSNQATHSSHKTVEELTAELRHKRAEIQLGGGKDRSFLDFSADWRRGFSAIVAGEYPAFSYQRSSSVYGPLATR